MFNSHFQKSTNKKLTECCPGVFLSSGVTFFDETYIYILLIVNQETYMFLGYVGHWSGNVNHGMTHVLTVMSF